MAVIGDRNDLGLLQGTDGSEFFAGNVSSDRSGHVHIDHAFTSRFLVDQRHCSSVFDHWGRVRHADESRKAAARCGRGACRDGFLRALARFPKMNMQIDQAGADNQAGNIDTLSIRRGGEILSKSRDPTVSQKEISRCVKLLAWIDQATAGKEQGTHWGRRYTHVN